MIPGRWGDATHAADPITVIGWIGTTFITAVAWFQGYLVRQKGWTIDDLRQGLFDARVAAILLGAITLMIVATAAEGLRGQELNDLVQVASQLQGTFGSFGKRIFAAGLFSAAYSSYLVNASIGGFLLADGLGLGSNPEQPWPRRLAALVLLLGMLPAIQVAVTGKPIVGAVVVAQATTVIIAPLLGVMLLLLTNRRDVMGEHRNGPLLNALAGIGLVVLVVMALVVLTTKVLPAIRTWLSPTTAQTQRPQLPPPPPISAATKPLAEETPAPASLVFRTDNQPLNDPSNHPINHFIAHRPSHSKLTVGSVIQTALQVPGGDHLWLIDRDGQWWRWSLAAERIETQSAKNFLAVTGLHSPARNAWLVSDARGNLAWMQDDGSQLETISAAAPDVDQWLGFDSQGNAIGLSRWGRALVRLRSLAPPTGDAKSFEVDQMVLPFAPATGALDANSVFVADAFGGQLARLDLSSWQIADTVTTEAFAFGALHLDSERLVMNHRVGDPRAPTDELNVSTGRCVDAKLSVLDLSVARIDLAGAWQHKTTIPLRNSTAFADPGVMLVEADGVWVASEGSRAIVHVAWQTQQIDARMTTGPLPIAILRLPNQSIWTLSRFEPQITQVDSQGQVTQTPLAADPPTLAQRGEQRFFDASLSVGGSLSCASCHVDGHSSFRMADTLGDDSYNTPKLVPSLLGTIDTDPWGWLGNRKEFADQVEQSVRRTQHGEISPRDLRDLVGYLAGLESPPGLRQARQLPSTAEHQRQLIAGRNHFERHCRGCHVPPLTYTTNGNFDIGLQDEAGRDRFNPPSLRGVSQRDRLLHDASATSLQALLQEADHPPGLELSSTDQAELITYLESL